MPGRPLQRFGLSQDTDRPRVRGPTPEGQVVKCFRMPVSILVLPVVGTTAAPVGAQRPPQPPSAIELTTTVSGVAAPQLPRLTPADVYANADRVRAASDPCDGDATACVERGLRRLQARPAVRAVVPLTDGVFFTRIVPRGVVSVATSMNVYAANSLEQTWLVNGTPALIPVSLGGDEIAHALAIDPSRAAALPSGVDRTQLMRRGDPARLVAVRHQAGGVTRYVFRDQLVVGCHACATGGTAEYAYDVDAHGRALRKVFLRFLPSDDNSDGSR